MSSDGLFLFVLECRGRAYIYTHGRVELEGVAAGGGFGGAESHAADCGTQLVDEYAACVGACDGSREFAHGLRHESCL